MSTWNPRANDLFLEAIELHSYEERRALLDRDCGADEALRAEVERLLEASDRAGSFLDRPAIEVGSTTVDRRPGDESAAIGLDATGSVIGPYKLLERIGEGGMGTVYMAEQTRPVRRKVALKVIKPGMDSRQVIARFEAERQALAIMDHANIARVLDAGATEAGLPYFVMELVHGVPITKYCDDNQLTPRERLELFVLVCQAIQHAHQKGIIHRDIKPSNVMITLYDGNPVPKVIDFGVAKATEQNLTERTLFTQYGTLVGTLEYMSPEQAEMSALGVDTRSDIYSLGVLLFELLTGSTPLGRKRVREAAYGEALRMIKEEEPPRPSMRLSESGAALASISAQRHMEPARLTKLVRGELDWIVMKTLEKDRNRRYEAVNGFAADVQRYLDDEPVQACPPSTLYRFRKFARRNRRAVATAAAAAVVVMLAVAGLATSNLLLSREQRATANALQAETRAKDDLEKALYFQRIALAHRELSVDNLHGALKLLDACPKELREWEWHYLMRLCRVEPLILRGKAEVNSLAFSSDGEFLATALGDGGVTVYNSRTGKSIRTLGNMHSDSVFSVAFHRDGRHLASVGADRKVKVWDWTTGRNVFTCPSPSDADHNRGTGYGLAFSPDGRRLAVASDGAVHVWDWENQQPVLPPLRGHAKKGISVAFSPDGRRLASGSWSGEVMIWDAQTGELVHTLAEHHAPVSSLVFSPDGRRLVSACFDRRLIVWDATTGVRLRTVEAGNGLVLGVAVSPDGSRLASAGEDKTLRVWESATGREILDLRGHTGWSQGVAFSPDGLRLASAGGDGTVRIWDATPLRGDEAQEAFTLSQGAGEVWTLAVSPDGRRLASAGLGADSRVKVRDLNSRLVTFEFTGHWSVVFCVAWHPDGQRIASSGLDAERTLFVVRVWDARTGEVGLNLPIATEAYAVAFSPDGEYLVTGSANRTVQVWDARAGRQLGKFGTHGRPVLGLAFSRDGRRLASASGDGVVKLWDWDPSRLGDEQKPRRTFRARVPLAGMTFAFSPDGRRLVAGGEEHTVRIWDLQTEQVQDLRGHSGDVWATAFSPDPEGRWVASGGEDTAVKVWDTRSGELVHSFRGHTGLVSSVAFSPDGRQLFSGSRDKTVKVWNLTQPDQGPGL
jgi:eukaryotic-like serine/threonine-protein kinase